MGFSRQEYWSGLLFPSPADHVLSEFSAMTHPTWVAPHSMAHSFIELDKEPIVAEYTTGEEWGNNSRKNEEMEPKQKQHPVVDVTGNGSKLWCCKEQYCIGTCNVRFVNQGKLEVFKQEMARVNIDILGVSELKWTGMGEFNSDGHYIYYFP